MLRSAACALTLLACAGGAAETQAPGPSREPWSRGSSRFVRQWQLLGALSPSAARGPSPPGDPEVGSWVPHTSFSDVLEVAGALGLLLRRPRPEMAYAQAVVSREHDGEAELSFGHDGGARVWVDGRLVCERPGSHVFFFDDVRVPVRLKQGPNRLRIELTHENGPWRLSLRVLEPGAVLPRVDEIAPVVETSSGRELIVRTHAAEEPSAAPVEVSVVGAGGRRVAESSASRGARVRFDQGSWPDGAYELRCATRDPWDRPRVRYLAWYKGDAVAAARRLVADARTAPDDAGGGTVRMLSELVLDRLGGRLDEAPADAWQSLHAALLESEELEQSRSGRTGPIRPSGFLRLAYRDDVDGSFQFCRVYLPPGYAASRRWPLVVNLHGYNPPNPPYVRWWSVDERHSAVADREDVIVVEPHGRGNAQYLGIGERDVLRCLEEAKKALSVDDERVYLTGESMGGSGTWLIASRHPDLFAAVAPVFGGWDFRLLPGSPFTNPNATTVPERFVREAQSSFAGAEGLLNVPILVHHGDSDDTVPVEYSRHVVRLLQRWGYDVQYQEHPGWGHEDLGVREAVVEWLLQHRRVSAPRHVRLRSIDLAAAHAYWVRVDAGEEPLRTISVDAEVVRPGLVRLDTDNVAEVSLLLPETLRAGAASLDVRWNGRLHRALPLVDGRVSLRSPEAAPGTVQKGPGFEGRLSSLIATPFAVVVGTTSPDSRMRELCRSKAAAFAGLWTAWQHHAPRLLDDTQVGPEEESRYSLLLVGGADANLVTRRMTPRLPLRVDPDGVTIDGRRLPASDAVVEMIYPSPAAADRYLLVVAGTSAEGLYFWNPSALWDQIFGFPRVYWDWTVRDGRRVALDPGLGAERGWVAAGVFDRHWRRHDRFVFTGDAERRARSPLRHPAPAGFAPSPDALQAYAGRYELAPGFPAVVTCEGGRLVIRFPSGPPVELMAETATDFALPANGAVLTFAREGSGAVTGIVIDNDGQQTRARRLD